MSKKRRLLSEAKKDLELAIVKALCQAPLRPVELTELLAINESDLIRDHGCDLYMAEKVVSHTKHEQYRMRAQNLYTPDEDIAGLYPEQPYTRTSPVAEGFSGDLRKIMSDARKVKSRLVGAREVPHWCEHKISQSKAMLQSVNKYLAYHDLNK